MDVHTGKKKVYSVDFKIIVLKESLDVAFS